MTQAMGTHTCNPSTQRGTKFETSLGYTVRISLKIMKGKRERRRETEKGGEGRNRGREGETRRNETNQRHT